MKKLLIYLSTKPLWGFTLILILALTGGGNFAWADSYVETLTFVSSSPSGWTCGEYTAFTNDELTPTKSWYTAEVYSDESIELVAGQKIIITAKATAASGSTVKYCLGNTINPSSASRTFTNTDLSESDYLPLEISITSNQDKYIKINCYKAVIQKIEFKPAVEVPDEVILDETGVSTTDFSSLVSATSIESVKVKYTSVKGWNSVCMPFSLKGAVAESTFMSTIFGTGWRAYGLSSYSEGVLSFTQRGAMNSMMANIPYLVYCEDPQTPPSDGFSFSNVDITYSSTRRSTSSGATFQGTYAPMAAGTMEGKYGVNPIGQIRPGNSSATLNGFRAYFTGISAPAAAVRLYIIDDDETTDVGLFRMMENDNHPVYNLNGQKVQQTRKGLYVINGKKIVVK